jgi:hypothetical protein
MRACDRREDDPREELLREELWREEVLPEDALREEAPREDLTELLPALADLDAPLLLEALLLLEPLVFLELPVEPLLDLLLPDRTFAEDDVHSMNVKNCSCVTCRWILMAWESPFPVYSCAMNSPAAQDANNGGKFPLNILLLLRVATCALWLDRSNDSTLKCRQALWPQSALSGT